MEQYKATNLNLVIRMSDGLPVHFNPDLPEYQQYLADIAGGSVVIPDDTSLTQVKAEQIHLINQAADAAFAVITSPYPKQDPDGWPNQYAEAWALQSDPNAYCPTLTAISIAAGINLSALATSVLQKAAAYNQAYGSIVGKRKKLTDQVNAATIPEEAKAWTW